MKTLTKSSGLPLLRSMMEDFWNVDNFFNKPIFTDDFLPAVNIKSKKNEYVIEVAAPGFKKDDFNVDIEDGLLRISASSSESKEEDAKEFTRREFSTSSFERTFTLPEQAVQDHVKAKYEDGLLKITLEKNGKSTKPVQKVKID